MWNKLCQAIEEPLRFQERLQKPIRCQAYYVQAAEYMVHVPALSRLQTLAILWGAAGQSGGRECSLAGA